jgi:hypothetical protein
MLVDGSYGRDKIRSEILSVPVNVHFLLLDYKYESVRTSRLEVEG